MICITMYICTVRVFLVRGKGVEMLLRNQKELNIIEFMIIYYSTQIIFNVVCVTV